MNKVIKLWDEWTIEVLDNDEFKAKFLELSKKVCYESEEDREWVRDSAIYGATFGFCKTILINSTCSLSTQKTTLSHELLHAIIEDAQLDLGRDNEERIVRALSLVFNRFMDENTRIFEEIF